MLKNTLMQQLISQVSEEDKALIDDSYALSDRIAYLLKKHKMSQKDLAIKLGKRESEVSKWLSGTHNFTQATLTKISLAIGERIYDIPNNTTVKKNKATVLFEFEEESIHLFKSLIVRIKAEAKRKHIEYENYRDGDMSSLSVNATGIIVSNNICKSDFKPAKMIMSDFKNIEKASI